MKAYEGVDVWIHVLLTSALVWGECTAWRPGRFTLGERACGTHWIRSWVGPRAGLDDAEKRRILTLPGLELWPLGRRTCRQSLYRLRCTGSGDYQAYTNVQQSFFSVSLLTYCSSSSRYLTRWYCNRRDVFFKDSWLLYVDKIRFNLKKYFLLAHRVYLCVFCDSWNIRRWFSGTALACWCLSCRRSVFRTRFIHIILKNSECTKHVQGYLENI
jgi:hypothetical protein